MEGVLNEKIQIMDADKTAMRGQLVFVICLSNNPSMEGPARLLCGNYWRHFDCPREKFRIYKRFLALRLAREMYPIIPAQQSSQPFRNSSWRNDLKIVSFCVSYSAIQKRHRMRILMSAMW